MFGKLNTEEIEQVLMQQVVGRLGCHAHGITYVVPVSYAYDGSFIYGRSFEGMKINMMRVDPKVCFQVDIMNNMADWQSVIAWGIYEELKHTTERNEALQKLMDRRLPLLSSETTHLSPVWPFTPHDINEIRGIVFRILVTEKTGRFEKITATIND
jgi:nitroimidazol reductase NimA-like FMN-containing flavoprotein (pyridoxamine 5'-phosphate oxidase superfamily)